MPTVATIPFTAIGFVPVILLREVKPPVGGGKAGGANWAIFTNITLFGPLSIAFLLWLVHAYARQDGGSPGDALWVTLAAGLTTPLLVYSKTMFPQNLEAIALMAMLLLAARWRQSGSGIAALALGLATAVGVMSRPIFPPVLLAPCYLLLAGQRSWRERVVALVLFAIPVALAGGLVGGWNHIRWGSPFDFGRHRDEETFTTPLYEGLYGLLASPGKGLLIYAPALLVPLMLLRSLWQRGRAEVIFVLAASFAYLGLYGCWYDWQGGLAWGPRFLIALIAPWLALLPRAFSTSPIGAARLLLLIAAISGFSVQLPGVLLDPKWMIFSDGDAFDPSRSYVVTLAHVLFESGPDDLWLWDPTPSVRILKQGIACAFLACVAWGTFALARRAATPGETVGILIIPALAVAVEIGSFLVR
ncbi:MAG TPA: hypothetical protein VFE62_28945 [Gemmataceae bacterium]|nr:hypothetical protein [Gemmataceae bacterium]